MSGLRQSGQARAGAELDGMPAWRMPHARGGRPGQRSGARPRARRSRTRRTSIRRRFLQEQRPHLTPSRALVRASVGPWGRSTARTSVPPSAWAFYCSSSIAAQEQDRSGLCDRERDRSNGGVLQFREFRLVRGTEAGRRYHLNRDLSSLLNCCGLRLACCSIHGMRKQRLEASRRPGIQEEGDELSTKRWFEL